MAEVRVQRVTLGQLRGMEMLSGTLCVGGRTRRRRGVSSPESAVAETQPECGAATDDGNRANGDGVATSDATVPDGETNAGVAGETRGESGGTSQKKTKAGKRGAGGVGGGTGGDGREVSNERETLQGGSELPRDGWEFLEAVNEKIDVVRVMEVLLRSKDEKLAGRLTEQLLEMAYEKSQRVMDGEEQDIFDVPRPVRD